MLSSMMEMGGMGGGSWGGGGMVWARGRVRYATELPGWCEGAAVSVLVMVLCADRSMGVWGVGGELLDSCGGSMYCGD